MTTPSESYLKVPYDLRPAKQVERRMLLDAFQLLAHGRFQIRDYHYVGFGSIFFVDYVLLHRYLGIKKLTSVEYSENVKKRVKFNQPFDENTVDIVFGPIADYLPKMGKSCRYILWLDYDNRISREIISDIVTAASMLAPGSILLVTVDVDTKSDGGEPVDRMKYYLEEAERFFSLERKRSMFTSLTLPLAAGNIVENAILHGTNAASMRYEPLFNFLYADGHKMLTIGGMISDDIISAQLSECPLDGASYLRRTLGAEPFWIKVPVLTRRERMHLDARMPCADGWNPKEFEIEAEAVENYRDIYRFFPLYAELLS